MGLSRAWACAIVLMVSAASAVATIPATKPSRMPVPDRRELADAARHIDELLTRGTPHGPQALLKLAGETTSSPALRYSATVRAIGEAADGGQIPLVLKGLDQLGRDFDSDKHGARLDTIRRLAAGPVNPLAILVMRWTEDCYRDGKLDTAAKMVEVLRARRKEVTDPLSATVNDFLEDAAYLQSLVPKATTRPSTGVFECLYQNAWPTHLKALAASGDPLADTARQDISATDKAARMKAADAWWQQGSACGGLTGWRIARRSVAIYAELVPDINGVERELVAGRLNEHVRKSLEYSGYAPGVLREISRGGKTEMRTEIVSRIQIPRDDPTIDFPRSDPHVVYRGVLMVGTPGPYQLIFTGGSSLRVALDGTPIVDNPAISRKRNGEKVTVDLEAGAHTVEIELTANSSKPHLTTEWITPGTAERSPIPASALYHDPLTRPTRMK